MAELKTQKNDESVQDYLNGIENEQRREDCKVVYELMKKVTGDAGNMWGKSIVGFGSYHYVYASGREGDWMLTGFSNRAQNITLYIMSGFKRYEELLEKLGKHKIGKSCLYIKRLSDIDMEILEEMVRSSVDYMKEKYK